MTTEKYPEWYEAGLVTIEKLTRDYSDAVDQYLKSSDKLPPAEAFKEYLKISAMRAAIDWEYSDLNTRLLAFVLEKAGEAAPYKPIPGVFEEPR